MTDRPGKCPECGGPTLAYELSVHWLPVKCDKCRESDLARQNLARKVELQRQWKELCPPLFRATDTNHPAIHQDLLARVLEWDPAAAGGKGIGLHGPTGGCKTRIMFLLLRKLHYVGAKIRWVSAIELSRASSEMFDDDAAIKRGAKRLLQNAARADVLF